MPVAQPTITEVWTMIRQASKIFMSIWLHGVNGVLMTQANNNLTTLVGSLAVLIEGVYAGNAELAARALMSSYSDVTQTAKAMVDPLILEMGRIIGSSATAPEDILDDLYRYMIANTITIQDRTMSHDTTPTAGGGNVGGGTVVRLVTDKEGNTLENTPSGGITLQCVADKNSGAVIHEEQWEIRGVSPTPLFLDYPKHQGVGTTTTAGPSTSLLDNSSFDDDAFSGAAPIGWTVDDAANAVAETSTVYIGARGVRFTADNGLTQVLDRSLDENAPYCLIVIWNRNGSAGDLTLELGAVTDVVTVAAQSGWQVSTIASWYNQFKDFPTLEVGVDWDGTTHGIIIDAIILVSMTASPTDDSYFVVTPASDAEGGYAGGRTGGDTFAFEDDNDDTSQGYMQWTLALLYNKWLPSDSSPSVADVSFA